MRVARAPRPGDVIDVTIDGQSQRASVDSWSDGHLILTVLEYTPEPPTVEKVGTMQRSAEDFEADVTKPKRKRAASTTKKGTGKTPKK